MWSKWETFGTKKDRDFSRGLASFIHRLSTNNLTFSIIFPSRLRRFWRLSPSSPESEFFTIDHLKYQKRGKEESKKGELLIIKEISKLVKYSLVHYISYKIGGLYYFTDIEEISHDFFIHTVFKVKRILKVSAPRIWRFTKSKAGRRRNTPRLDLLLYRGGSDWSEGRGRRIDSGTADLQTECWDTRRSPVFYTEHLLV